MRLLTSEKKHLFVDKLMKIRQQLIDFKPKNTLQSLELFENQLILNKIEACFFDSKPDEINTNLIHLLSSRWQRIRYSNMCYTQQPDNLVNELCFEIAKEIAPPASTASEIEALNPNTGPYCLLMPSLENTEDVYGNNIHSLGLHEFVLSDNARVFIPLAQCLHQASISDEGQLRQTVAIDGQYPMLTLSEIERVSHHSKQAGELYQSIIALNKQRLLGDDIGAKLSQLANALRGGGARGSGSELNAGSEANLGILAFGESWEALSEQQKLAIFTEEPELKNILGRLFRPNDVNYTETRFCVELLAGDLDPIIQRYNKKPTVRTLQDLVLKQENAFSTAAQNHYGLAIIPKEIPPKHILHHIFKLNIDEQKILFKQQGYESALMYALAYEPDALIEFELDEKSKQYVISVQVNTNNDSALIVAAKKGETNVIELLLSWGAQIESHDLNNTTAIHWAAYNGHIDAVACLLEHGALLEARGSRNNSTLNFAVMQKKAGVVELLFKKNANLNARNIDGQNALDIAIAICPEFVEPILMQLAKLSVDEQAECLLSVPGGPYPNVLFYAAANKPALFDTLVNNILQQSNPLSIRAVFDTTNEKGYTSLILAAQIGAHESLRKLLAFDLQILQIESYDLYYSTALHWAAYNGHIDAVACLLEYGALLEARAAGNNSTLNLAVVRKKGGVVELLLKKNVNVNARNNEGLNALDFAIAISPEFVEPILMQLAKLSVDEQAECLLNVPGGPYPNVLFYAAAHEPALFDRLVNNILQQSNPPSIHAVLDTTNEKGYTSLILAAQIGAHESLRKLLAFDLEIESHDLSNRTALHWAANNGHVDAVACLLEHGALLEARGDGNSSALNFAVMQKKAGVVELLFKKNANLNARNIDGQNALDIAIAIRPQFVEPMLMQLAKLSVDEQAECLLNVPGGPYPNVLFYAAANKPALFDTLVNNVLQQSNPPSIRAVFDTTNKKGYTSLILAAQIGSHESLRKLLAFDLEIESHDLSNSTALHWAAYNGHIDAVACLLEHGALLEARGDGNSSALNFAVMRKKTGVVEPLLKKNANINARDNRGMNALDIAIAIHPEFVEPMLMQLAKLSVDEQAECLLNVPGGPYPNVLFYAAANKPALFDTLVNNVLQQSNPPSIRAVFDTTNEKGYTSLILAAQIGAHESLRKLLAFDLEIESHDLKNSTALHWAAYNGHIDAVACLLEHGALLEARGDENNSTLNFAVMRKKAGVVELLFKKNANLNARNIDGQNALDIAIAIRPEFVEPMLMQLAKLSVDEQAECLLNAPGGPYPNVLFYAAANETALGVVELLVKKNVNLNARNIDGQNALDIAIKNRRDLVEPILMQLATLPEDEQAECLLNVPGGPYNDIYAYVAAERPQFFNSLFKESNASTADITDILSKMHFDEHIEQISTHYQRMKEKSLSNSNYIDAAFVAKTLLIECGKAKVALFQSDATTDAKICLFKNTCKNAIETARPVLKNYREWGKALATFLIAIITLPFSLPLCAMGFFSIKTKSEQLVDKLHEAIDKPNLLGGG